MRVCICLSATFPSACAGILSWRNFGSILWSYIWDPFLFPFNNDTIKTAYLIGIYCAADFNMKAYEGEDGGHFTPSVMSGKKGSSDLSRRRSRSPRPNPLQELTQSELNEPPFLSSIPYLRRCQSRKRLLPNFQIRGRIFVDPKRIRCLRWKRAWSSTETEGAPLLAKK